MACGINCNLFFLLLFIYSHTHSAIRHYSGGGYTENLYTIHFNLCIDPSTLLEGKLIQIGAVIIFGEVQHIIFFLHRLISAQMIVCKQFSLH